MSVCPAASPKEKPITSITADQTARLADGAAEEWLRFVQVVALTEARMFFGHRDEVSGRTRRLFAKDPWLPPAFVSTCASPLPFPRPRSSRRWWPDRAQTPISGGQGGPAPRLFHSCLQDPCPP